MNPPDGREPFRRLHDAALDPAHRLDLRNTLIEQNLKLVDYCARDLHVRSDLHEDVLQAGREGLIKAVDRYNPEDRAGFGTYARCRITGQMLHYLRDQGSTLRLPRRHRQDLRVEVVSLETCAIEPACTDVRLLSALVRIDLERALSHLSSVERQVVDLYLVHEWSQSRIAARLGMTQVQVSRLLKRTLKELRNLLERP